MKIQIYQNIQDMSGIGEEWLVDAKGDVRAVFIDGSMACEVFYLPVGNTEVTKVS